MNLLLNQKKKTTSISQKYLINFHCLSSLHVNIHLYGMQCTVTILKTKFTFNYKFD